MNSLTQDADAGAGFDAAGAFSLLGDETRVEILRALAGRGGEPTSFADLRERVGVDDSGRFNYHLGKLVGTFVDKTDEGYKLTYAGTRVVGAVYEGAYAAGETIDPVDLDTNCPDCDGTLELTYTDETIRISCRDCEEVLSKFGFPPGAVADRDPADLPLLLSRHMQTLLERLRAGFCVTCSGPVTPVMKPKEDDAELELTFECDRCNGSVHTSLASVLMTDSVVVSFHHDHGIDVRETLPWSLTWLTDCTTEQVSESPLRYTISGTVDGETLRVEVDETLNVVEATRSPAAE
jgi:hypothetical protein